MTSSGEIAIWRSPADRVVPVRDRVFRFAVGTPGGPSANSWRAWVRGDDVYVKCRDNFEGLKASLHASGSWRFGFTQEFATSQPDLLPDGTDRVWTKVRPSFDDPKTPVVGFQIVVLRGGLYVGPEKRKSWPPSVLFVEPPAGDGKLTVLSVAVVQSQNPVRIGDGTIGAVVGILPLAKGWTAQVVATYEDVGTMEESVADALRRTVGQMGGISKVPDAGVLFVHGLRGEEIPWVSAVRFEKADRKG